MKKVFWRVGIATPFYLRVVDAVIDLNPQLTKLIIKQHGIRAIWNHRVHRRPSTACFLGGRMGFVRIILTDFKIKDNVIMKRLLQ